MSGELTPRSRYAVNIPRKPATEESILLAALSERPPLLSAVLLVR